MKPEILAVTILLAFAAYIDWKEHRVPNWLNYSAMGFGMLFCVMHSGLGGLWFSVLGIAAGFAALVVPYLLRGMGAGDVKLMMAVGAWLGAAAVFQGFVWTAVIGAVMGLAAMVYSHQLKQRLQTVGIASWNLVRLQDMNAGCGEDRPEMILLPYGVPIAFGFYAYFVFGGLL